MTAGGKVEVTAGRNLAPDEQRLVDAYTRVVELALRARAHALEIALRPDA